MKTYHFNPLTLQYEEIKPPKSNFLKILGIFGIIAGVLIISTPFLTEPHQQVQETKIQQYVHPFSEQILRQEIQKLNLPFEEVIVAQSKLETGNYTSEIFKCSNNLFGQKQAKVRVNCQSGVNHNHATYDNWVLSLYDYAFWYSTYASKIKNENEYLEFLSQVYAEDTTYMNQLKKIIKQNKDGK